MEELSRPEIDILRSQLLGVAAELSTVRDFLFPLCLLAWLVPSGPASAEISADEWWQVDHPSEEACDAARERDKHTAAWVTAKAAKRL